MGKVESKPLLRPPVAGWKRRICIIGCTRLSAQTGRARSIADAIVNAHKAIYETWYYFDNRSGFKQYLNKILKEMPPGHKFNSHKSAPFCWLELGDGKKIPLGGLDGLIKWAQRTFQDDTTIRNEQILTLCSKRLTLVSKEMFTAKNAKGTADTMSFYFSNKRNHF